jgi:CDGSH-type Zn-finger protein
VGDRWPGTQSAHRRRWWPRAPPTRCAAAGSRPSKPFYDGTHARIGFDGTVTAELEAGAGRRRTLVGTGIVMTDEPELCVHADSCETRLTT